MGRRLAKPQAGKPVGSVVARRREASVTVGELRSNFKAVEAKLAAGLKVEVTRRGMVVAEMQAPVREAGARPQLPDFIGRMKAIWGDRVLEIDTTALIAEGRERDF